MEQLYCLLYPTAIQKVKYLVLKRYDVEKAYFIYLDLCMSFPSYEISTKMKFFR